MDESYLIYPRLSWQLHSPVRYHGDASPHLDRCVPVIHLLPACRLVCLLVHPPTPASPSFSPFAVLFLSFFYNFPNFLHVLMFYDLYICNFEFWCHLRGLICFAFIPIFYLCLLCYCIIVYVCLCYDCNGGGTGGEVFWPLPPIM